VQLGINRLQDNKLLLHTEKTGVHVYCVLPDIVIKVLDAAPRSSEHYFFWTGKSTVRSAKGRWQRRLQRLFEFANVVGGHAHRFRDTFAVLTEAAKVACSHGPEFKQKNDLYFLLRLQQEA
jgi:hypothetical protein